jgi:predicted nucleic acid-binding protein
LILMDAGPMVALFSARDRHHRACHATLRRLREELVTVWPAVTEAMYLLDNPKMQDALWQMLLAENPRVLPLQLGDMAAMRQLMHKYSDRPMDLADAALVQTAERDDIRKIFTVDRADFAVYRVRGRALTILP